MPEPVRRPADEVERELVDLRDQLTDARYELKEIATRHHRNSAATPSFWAGCERAESSVIFG